MPIFHCKGYHSDHCPFYYCLNKMMSSEIKVHTYNFTSILLCCFMFTPPAPDFLTNTIIIIPGMIFIQIIGDC